MKRKWPDDFVNKIICGDCLEVMAEMPDGCVDLTVTSPPYGEIRDYGEDWNFDFKETANELFRVTAEGGVVVWVVGDQTKDGSESGNSFRQALYFKKIGFRLHDTMIYQKDGTPYCDSNRYIPIFEFMFILSKGKPKTINLIQDRRNIHVEVQNPETWRQKDGTMKIGIRSPYKPFGVRFNVWQFQTGFMKSTRDHIAYKHPAIFPDKLARDHIVSWCDEGNIVFDPMAGSGTVAKMAKICHRQFIAIDINPEYCEIAKIQVAQDVL